ncbi:hypothetical protein E1B28_007291 [Marasmius oreades]|uniref:MARVEL domain-containing protein n=1 Tax=Marasmius oreades TaxID=181124 RepID=A0A9P7S1I9_9AGAR|nr:uncharacterized protein E1B28_007291 [Marasmius oreades]KAG7093627.1 hypothetical protein E1B28_007291 [Marasmius oreades]
MAKGEKATTSNTSSLIARITYGFTFVLLFCLTASALGIDSHQLNKYGNGYARYPTKQYKHDLGLILFNCIFTFLWLLAHPFISMGISMFLTFVLAVFWGTAAGILFHVLPFGHTTCGHAVSTFPSNWQPYVSQCRQLTALHGLSWTIWGILTLLLFGSLIHKVRFTPRPHVSYYGRGNVANTV